MTISQPTLLVASASVDNDVSCNGGNDGQATASGSGGTLGYTYSWSSGATTATATSLAAGTYIVTITDANNCSDTASVTITEPSLLIASTSLGNDVSCNGGSDGSASASATGGTSPYTYIWSSGSTSSSATGLSAGTYTVTVTDNNGCTDTESITIAEPAVLNVSVAGTNVSCNGAADGQGAASASGGTTPYSYLWSTGSTASTATNLGPGTYTVTVTDGNGCTATASVSITQPVALVASIALDSNVSCNGGNDGSATASVSGGTPTYSFAWSSGSNDSIASSLSAGTYTVTVTDANGCTDTETITITEPSLLTTTTSVTGNVSCYAGSDGSGSVSALGGSSPYAYNWSSGATSTSASGLSAGTHYVTVSDAQGCETLDSITITQPDSLIANAAVLATVSCNGGSDGSISVTITGGTTAYGIAWSTGGTSSTLTSLPAGMYTVTITDANGCTDTASTEVTEPDTLNVGITLGNNVSCNGGNDGTATAIGTGGTAPYSYLWSNTTASASVSGLSAGTYTVTMTDANGCNDTSSITIVEPSVLVASAGAVNNVLCSGDSSGTATASASGGTGPYGFAWSTGDTTDTVTALLAGTYSVTITDDNGCTDSASITIVEPSAVNAQAFWISDAACNGEATGSAYASGSGGTGPYSYVWNTGSANDTLFNIAAGLYSVTIIDANGCSDSDTVSINEPAALSLTFALSDPLCNGSSDGVITSTTTGGTLPYSYLWTTGSTSANISGLSAGSYTLTVTDANGCSIALNGQLNNPSSVVASIAPQNNLCFEDSTGLAVASATGGAGNYSYAWNTGGSNDTLAGVIAGTYTVTVSDSNGCTDIETVTLTQPTALSASIAFIDSVACFGDSSGLAIAAASGGTSPYSYSWPSPWTSNNDSLINVPVGGYTVTVTDNNGCTDTAVAIVDQYPSLVLLIDSTQDVTCINGTDGYASVVASGGAGGYTYAWSNGSTLAINDSLSGGVHCVTVTDANGCSDTACVNLSELNPLPTINLGNDTAICDTVFTLDAGNAVAYNWSTGSSVQTIQIDSTDSYSVTITDAIGCENSDTVLVTFNPLVSFDVETDSTSCGGATGAALVTNLTGGGGYTLLWSSGQINTLNVSSLAYGAYGVTVTDGNGCSNDEAFFIYDDTDLEFDLFATDASCFGFADGSAWASVTSGTSPFYFDWSNGANSDTILGVSANMYVLTVTDSAGCILVDSIEVDQPDEFLLSAFSVEATCGDSNGLAAVNVLPSGSYTYLWNDPTAQTADTATNLPAGTYQVIVTASNGCMDSAYAIVSNVGAPSLAMAAVNESCGGSNDGFAVATASSSSPLTYLWSDGLAQTTDTASNLGSGLYFVSVTDTNGCIAIDSISVLSDGMNPVFSLGNDTSVCASSFALTAPTGMTAYLWSTGETNDTISLTSSGQYWLSVTNANGCSSTDTIQVDLYNAIAYTSTVNNSSCSQNTGAIAVTVTSSNGNALFIWNTGDTTSSVNSLGAGMYTVTISDSAGCSVEASFTIDNINAPVVSVDIINANCFGEGSGSANATVTNGTQPYSYAWSNGGFGSSQSNLLAGSYSLTVTDDSGCVVTAPFSITEPSEIMISIAGIQPDCGDSNGSALATVTNTQGPVTNYLWNDSAATTLPFVDDLPAGFYTIVVTDSAGCVASQSIPLSNLGAASLALFSSSNNCSNENVANAYVTAIGNGPFDYVWNDGLSQQNDTAFNLYNGTYAVSVTDTNGCVAVGAVAVQSLFVAPSISLGGDIYTCIGSEVILTPGNGFVTYLWNTGATSPSINVTTGQNYSVTISNSVGCSGSDSALVSFVAPPVIDLGNDTIVCVSDFTPMLTLDAGEGYANYAWSNGDTTRSIDVFSSGLYQVSVSDIPGCVGSDQVIVAYDTCVNVTTESLRGSSASMLRVFPNPNRGQFIVKFEGFEVGNYVIEMMNTSGQLVHRSIVRMSNSGSSLNSMDLSDTPRGVYLLSVKGDDLKMDQRVIIQ
ncbi:MAG: T9SS type A sorting domain-containing protein [Cryomorphaceae bacterium]